MTPLVNNILLLSIVIYFITILFEVGTGGKKRSFFIQLTFLVVFVGLITYLTGFPFPKVAFGATSSVLSLGIMFACVIVGMLSNYLFSIRKFSFIELM